MLRYMALLYSLTALATPTTFLWQNKTGQLFAGKCYEVDTKTQGEQYFNKTKTENCKPSDTLYSFHFETGHCLEIDSTSSGRNYLKKVAMKFCKPKSLVYKMTEINGKYACYQIDKETLGENFYAKTLDKNCPEPSQQFYWRTSKKGRKGCFIKNTKQEYMPVKNALCQPSEVIYVFTKADELRGNCFAEHPEGAHLYQQKVSLEKCKPKETEYFFIPASKDRSGACYEVDSATGGKEYLKKVITKLCK
jgi:hypothetical protein